MEKAFADILIRIRKGSRPDAISPIRTESELRLAGGERNRPISSEGGTDHV